MRQVRLRRGSLICVLLVMDAVCTTHAGAQDVLSERPVAAPVAEWHRGFTTITSVRELDGGRTLVADRGERRLYLVDWETGDLAEVLRHGDGPGEHRWVGWLYPGGDQETLFTDVDGHRWILLRGIEPIQTFTGPGPLNRRFGARLDGVATGGGVLASVSARSPGSSFGGELVLELASGLGPHDSLPALDTIRLIKGSGRSQIACVLAGGASACQFLDEEDQAILFPDGWIAVALQYPYRVDWRSPDGDWIRGDTLADVRVPLSEAEKCAAVSGWAEDVECDVAAVEGYLWRGVLPSFLTDARQCQACKGLAGGEAPWLFADPRGHLVIRRTPQRTRRDNRYDVIDRTGRLVERVTLPHGEAIVGFGESRVYTVREDEFDLQWLRRHPWGE